MNFSFTEGGGISWENIKIADCRSQHKAKTTKNIGNQRPFSVSEKSSVLGEGCFCYNLRSILTPGEMDDQ